MTLSISPVLQQARLAATLAALGSGARVLIYGGERPADGGDAATAPLLVEAPLADSPGVIVQGASGPQIALVPADPAGVLVIASGVATWARVLARGRAGTDSGAGQADVWLFDCDLCGPSGQGDWQIAVDGLPEGAPETRLYEGATFILGAVTLR